MKQSPKTILIQRSTTLFVVLWIGVGCAAKNPGWEAGIHAHLAWSERYLRVVDIAPQSPAARAGLRPGDYVITIDGWRVRGHAMKEVAKRLRGPSGTTVKLLIVRLGRVFEICVTREAHQKP